MSPHQQQAPVQSLPSFAHTFPDIAARTSHSGSASPQPPRAAGTKRRHDALDDRQTNPPSSPGSHTRRHKRLKSPARPPPRSNGHPHRPSSPPALSRSSSVSQDGDAIMVKEEDQDTDRDPSPPPATLPPPSLAALPAPAASYPLLEPLSRNKRRRVTISGAHLQPVPPTATRSPHPPGSVRASPNLSPLTPTVSPVVMGFSVPRTPQGVPHKTSVDQVRSALTLKQQQKALIEARRNNPNASLPLPTPPATGGSSAGSAVAPASAGGESVTASATGEGSHTDVLPQVKARTRSRAVTVTTGMALSGTPSRGGAGDYIREATRASIAERHAQESAIRTRQEEREPPPSRAVDRDGDVSMRPTSPRPPPASSHSHVNTPSSDRNAPPASTTPNQQPLSSPSDNVTASSLLVRRRGLGGNLGVNTSGISNAGSAVNTGASSSIPPSATDGEVSSAPGRRSGPSRTPILTVRTTNIDPPRPQAPEQPRPVNVEDAPPPLAVATSNSVRPPVFHPVGTGTLVSVPTKPFRAQQRNSLLNLDPVIRSAPLTLGGRMIINGRPPAGLRNDWAAREDRLPPLNLRDSVAEGTGVSRLSQRLSTAPQTPIERTRPNGNAIAASPTQLTNKHHSQLFPASSQPAVRAQVPISSTLRTPHVANFTIPPRSTGTQSTTTPPNAAASNASADKQGFLGLFGQFYDSLNDAKNLKTWLEGQQAKSDGLIANLERTAKEMEAERQKMRQEANEEVVRLRSRVIELEERLARLERSGEPHRMEVDRYEAPPRREYDAPSRRDRMDLDRDSEQDRGSSNSSPIVQRRPYDYPPASAPAYPMPPLQHHEASRRDRAPMPLPPIATLSNGIESRGDDGRSSRRGSIVGLPPPPPPSGGRSRRESFSNPHPMSLHPHSHSRNSSISPPQHPSLPPLRGRSPSDGHRMQHPQHISRGSSRERMTRGSPLAGHLPPPPQRSPYPHRLQVVARPSPTPSPPPHASHHRLVGRVSDV